MSRARGQNCTRPTATLEVAAAGLFRPAGLFPAGLRQGLEATSLKESAVA